MVRRATTVLLVLPLAACVLAPKGSSDAGADGAAPVASNGGSGADAAVKDCAQDPLTKTILCTAVAQCSGLAVQHDVFPNCGFRPRAGGFDLACWCNGYVCPMGSPTTCAEAKQLLDNQSELQICTQVAEGRCTQPQGPTGSGGAPGGGASTGTKPGCAPECMQQCGYTPGCKDLCGC